MSGDHETRAHREVHGRLAEDGPAPGKRPRTAGRAVQRRLAAATGGGLPFMDAMLQAEQVKETAAAGVAGAGGDLPHLDRIQASFGGEHDLSGVRASVGGDSGRAAAAIGAEAYATGDRVAFQRAPDVHTTAHEAAHVLQQRSGVQLDGGVGRDGDAYERHADAVADRVVAGQSSADLLDSGGGGGASSGVQMRRVIADPDALLNDPADASKPGANTRAHTDGLNTLIARAREEMSSDELKAYGTELLGGMSTFDFMGLPRHEILARMSKAIAKIRPDLAFGDPALIDTGARSGTSDAANIAKLVKNAREQIFDPIIAGSHDTDLEQVFSKRKVGTAKAKYRQGRAWMMRLARRDKVVTDRSGYYEEASIGGLTGTHEQIALGPATIDNPDAPESIITMVHEAMHAGNPDVDDHSYVEEGNFTEEATGIKLKNAAHFEVVARRILLREALKTDPTATDDAAFEGKPFVPAGTTAGGTTAPPLTDAQKAMKAAKFRLRESWDRAINLHRFFVESYKAPRSWNRWVDGHKHKHFLPYWSKVENLTIHKKNEIEPASSDVAKHPVSQIDCALSEGVIRRFGEAYDNVPANETGLTKFEADNAAPDEITEAHKSVDAHRDFIIRLCLGLAGVHPITGSVDRDFRVVAALNTPWDHVFRNRSPDDFAD